MKNYEKAKLVIKSLSLKPYKPTLGKEWRIDAMTTKVITNLLNFKFKIVKSSRPGTVLKQKKEGGGGAFFKKGLLLICPLNLYNIFNLQPQFFFFGKIKYTN